MLSGFREDYRFSDNTETRIKKETDPCSKTMFELNLPLVRKKKTGGILNKTETKLRKKIRREKRQNAPYPTPTPPQNKKAGTRGLHLFSFLCAVRLSEFTKNPVTSSQGNRQRRTMYMVRKKEKGNYCGPTGPHRR